MMTTKTGSGIAAPFRRPTRTVAVGDVAVGSAHPIRIQSMTTPSTRDTAATADQIERLVDAGCEIVRITVPTTGDAENLPNIRAELARRRIRVPLVADIHFTPAAAMKAIDHVEKIRINPGNYADKKKFAVREYTDSEYAEELERIARTFTPLVQRARQLGVSMRIGTNHGSLSDRIMNRYGDSPEGMVESALEFVRICEALDYRELILSMKASNPVVVLAVYRLLARRMADEQMDYPFHLGVTEAGDGEDGRVKSAIGIGALLDEGIGDTIRVSITEDPVKEIPVARALAEALARPAAGAAGESGPALPPVVGGTGTRRESREVPVGPVAIGGARTVAVEVSLLNPLRNDAALRAELDSEVGVRVPEETRPEVVSVRIDEGSDLESLESLGQSMRLVAPRVALSARLDPKLLQGCDEAELDRWLSAVDRLHLRFDGPGSVCQGSGLLAAAAKSETPLLLEAGAGGGEVNLSIETALSLAARAREIGGPVLLALEPDPRVSPLHATRELVSALTAAGLDFPVVLLDRPADRDSDDLLGSASALGALLCEGVGDAIQIQARESGASRRLAFGILQAARVRITRTEFISCPSCGRTLFDLEETTARIKARTSHLKGLKIAVMGCIVNGPGEMADADFGYVGWGEDKIALFVGKEMVVKDVPTAEADGRLVELIKTHGRWVDPPS